jgi:hypothetical protein
MEGRLLRRQIGRDLIDFWPSCVCRGPMQGEAEEDFAMSW